jgi:hypothetical protein
MFNSITFKSVDELNKYVNDAMKNPDNKVQSYRVFTFENKTADSDTDDDSDSDNKKTTNKNKSDDKKKTTNKNKSDASDSDTELSENEKEEYDDDGDNDPPEDDDHGCVCNYCTADSDTDSDNETGQDTDDENNEHKEMRTIPQQVILQYRKRIKKAIHTNTYEFIKDRRIFFDQLEQDYYKNKEMYRHKKKVKPYSFEIDDIIYYKGSYCQIVKLYKTNTKIKIRTLKRFTIAEHKDPEDKHRSIKLFKVIKNVFNLKRKLKIVKVEKDIHKFVALDYLLTTKFYYKNNDGNMTGYL